MSGTLDRYLACRFEWRPVDATFMGASGHDHRMPRTGPEAAEAEREEVADLLAAVGAAEDLDPADRQLLLGELRVEHDALALRPRHRNPAWHTGEAAFGIVSLLLPRALPFDTGAVASRLAAIPGFLSDGAAALAGHAVPAGWADRARRECAAMATFLREDIALHEGHAAAWDTPAEHAARAFERYADALDGLPDADPACGADHLSFVMREQHKLPYGPAEAVERARATFESTGRELQEMAHAIDPGRSWQRQLADLTDIGPRSQDEVIEDLRRLDDEALSAADGLVTPETEYGLDYRFFPDWTRTIRGALYFLFYRSPPAFAPGQGSVYWVAPEGGDRAAYLAAHSTAMLKTIHAVHHGSVGHHTQNANARRAPTPLARIAGTDCAMGLAFNGAGTLIEGWACYVEDLLMEAEGFYSPAECLLLKSFERRNAASVLVDVNLHTGTWSQDEATRFYVDEAGFAPARAPGEVVRNSMFPGSRLMYWAGVEGIRALRRRWTGNLQDFHDRLLAQGHVPLAVVGEAMDAEGSLRA
ncbi:DUF885 family protein [Wenxinia saemankumensis]|uniref:DUF885 domain-containing protein n=1 Tax=Wenxinia saemankumensis TaxID=1447782 RepID=A0A1M6BR52_9RHOB|nr:DUF885 family protein [Wenxinia saemankumensis]SHI51157.1 protein of unknown function [Wenxinia saemankumensis]